jgi:pimeloyl-ACP methyl ester carboxylesterase
MPPHPVMTHRDPPPGRLVDIGGFRLHVNCGGEGLPTVILDAALGGSSVSWCFVQQKVAEFARACAYDRGGLGWSETGPMPRTAGRMVHELRMLLDRANIDPPYVMVGHSFGTLIARLFAARHRHDVVGLVLVDPAFPEDWLTPNAGERRRMRRGVRLCRYGAAAARLGLTGLVTKLAGGGPEGLAKAATRFVSRRSLQREPTELLSPIDKLPVDVRARLTRMWTQPRFFHALGSQIDSICTSAEELMSAGEVLGELPLAVVSATRPHPHHVMMQERLVATSSRGRRIVAVESGHWVPLEDPATVVAAVRDVVETVRSGARRQSAPR